MSFEKLFQKTVSKLFNPQYIYWKLQVPLSLLSEKQLITVLY